MRIDGVVAAVEVKTRVGDDPANQLTAVKRRRMVQAASALRPRPDRIDLITVQLDRRGATIRWIPAVV